MDTRTDSTLELAEAQISNEMSGFRLETKVHNKLVRERAEVLRLKEQIMEMAKSTVKDLSQLVDVSEKARLWDNHVKEEQDKILKIVHVCGSGS